MSRALGEAVWWCGHPQGRAASARRLARRLYGRTSRRPVRFRTGRRVVRSCDPPPGLYTLRWLRVAHHPEPFRM